jgi:ABC-type uncharacterized transport system substrate-binding protein
LIRYDALSAMRAGMRRRKFLVLVGSTTVTFTAWPLATVAQEPVTPTIGYLDQRAPSDAPALLNAFRQGLREKGYVDGRNVKIEYRWASGDYARLPGLVSELVARAVSVLVAVGGEPAALAAKAATSNIPIIFSVSGDPVAFGLVDSLSRPGTNATGVTQFGSEVVAKRLQLVHELAPSAIVVGLLLDENWPATAPELEAILKAALSLDLHIVVQKVQGEGDLRAAFTRFAKERAGAVLVQASPMFTTAAKELVALSSAVRIVAVYGRAEIARAGGLVSYGSNLADGYRLVGNYAGQVLGGEKVENLPVVEPTKLELIVNLKTAKSLGIELPMSIMVRADEVIE